MNPRVSRTHHTHTPMEDTDRARHVLQTKHVDVLKAPCAPDTRGQLFGCSNLWIVQGCVGEVVSNGFARGVFQLKKSRRCQSSIPGDVERFLPQSFAPDRSAKVPKSGVSCILIWYQLPFASLTISFDSYLADATLRHWLGIWQRASPRLF